MPFSIYFFLSFLILVFCEEKKAEDICSKLPDRESCLNIKTCCWVAVEEAGTSRFLNSCIGVNLDLAALNNIFSTINLMNEELNRQKSSHQNNGEESKQNMLIDVACDFENVETVSTAYDLPKPVILETDFEDKFCENNSKVDCLKFIECCWQTVTYIDLDGNQNTINSCFSAELARRHILKGRQPKEFLTLIGMSNTNDISRTNICKINQSILELNPDQKDYYDVKQIECLCQPPTPDSQDQQELR